MGADDRAAEGGAAESRTAFRRARFTGQIRKRVHVVTGRAGWKSLAVSKRNAALTVREQMSSLCHPEANRPGSPKDLDAGFTQTNSSVEVLRFAQHDKNECECTEARRRAMTDAGTQRTKESPLQYVTDQLTELRARGVAPELRVLEGEQKPVCIFDGREVINLASNNYLGLTTHKALRKAA